MNYDLIDNIELDGIDTNDYPDFCDAYIVSADYDGLRERLRLSKLQVCL